MEKYPYQLPSYSFPVKSGQISLYVKTSCKPFFELVDADLADEYPVRSRDKKIDRQASIKPEVDITYRFLSYQVLAVGTEKIGRVKLLGKLVQRLRENIFFPVLIDCLDTSVVNVK